MKDKSEKLFIQERVPLNFVEYVATLEAFTSEFLKLFPFPRYQINAP